MAYTDRFFKEACDMEVSYLNPFQIVSMGPGVDLKQLEGSAHLFSEVVGLGLRHRVQCPVEINLLPQAIRQAQAFRRRKPYLLGAAAAVVGIALLGLLAESSKRSSYDRVSNENKAIVDRLTGMKAGIESEGRRQQAIKDRYDLVVRLLEQRNQIPGVLNEIQNLKPADVWVAAIHPIYEDMKAGSAAGRGATPAAPAPSAGFSPFGMSAMSGGATPTRAGQPALPSKIYGFEIVGHSVTVKADPASAAAAATVTAPPAAVPEAAHGDVLPLQVFFARLKKSAMFDPDSGKTVISLFQHSATVNNLDTFVIQLKLQKPIDIPR
jgi:hypothetical protein